MMDKFTKCFIVASLIYLLLGSSLGVLMVLRPSEWRSMEYYLIPSHAHLNLIGWVSMLIFGVAYHIFPRFSGRLIYSTKLAWLHFWLAQAGLAGMAIFFFLNRWQEGEWKRQVAVSGILMFISICCFVYNMLVTLLAKEESHG